MVKIEEGKFYKTRDGRKVGPMKLEDWTDGQPWTCDAFEYDAYWSEDGNYLGDGTEHNDDLIDEWPSDTQGPIREIRRREIVPGVYGRVAIGEERYDDKTKIVIHLADSSGEYKQYDAGMWMTADELREAAHLLNQLAEFLDEEGE